MKEESEVVQGLDRIRNRATLCLDTETTGLKGAVRVVEISVVDLWSGEVLLDTLVNPSTSEEIEKGKPFPISRGAREVHGITATEVADAPKWFDVVLPLSRIFAHYDYMVVYNAAYDLGVLRSHHEAYFGGSYRLEWPKSVCAMTEFGNRYSQWSTYWGSFRWVKLEEATRMMGIEFIDAHTALADALATRSVVLKMLEENHPPQVAPGFGNQDADAWKAGLARGAWKPRNLT